MTKVQDRRRGDEVTTHTTWICGTDTFLSGWGEAADGASIAAWACLPEHADAVEEWITGRTDMTDVFRLDDSDEFDERLAHAAHVSIYTVDEEHPALRA